MTPIGETFYTVKELMSIFHCGINRAYALMKLNDLPTEKIGGVLAVEDSALREWLQKQIGKTRTLKA